MQRILLVLLFLFLMLFTLNINALQKSKADSLKILLLNEKADTIKVNLCYKISKNYWYSNQDSALFYARKGLNLAQKSGYRKGEADCFNSLGAVSWMQSNYISALDYSLQNLGIKEEIKDQVGIFNANNNLGLIYYELKKDSMSLFYINKALAIAEKIQDSSKISKANTNLGMIYQMKGDNKKAMQFYEIALKYLLPLKDSMDISYLYYDIGEALAAMGKPDALSYFKQSYEISKKIGNKEMIAACLQIFSEESRKAGNFKQSIAMATQALELAKSVNNLKEIELSARNLYKTYKLTNDTKNCLYYLEMANSTKDSMMGEQKLKDLAELKFTYDLTQKQKHIELLEKDKLLAKKSIVNLRLSFILLLVAIMLLALIAFFIYRRRLEKHRQIEREKYENELIIARDKAEESDKLKSAFLGNLSHELRTPMNAIKGFSQLLEKQDISAEKRLKYIKLINKRADDLLNVVNDLIDISKLEVGQMLITENSIDLNSMLLEIYQFFIKQTYLFDSKSIEFSFNNDLKTDQSQIFGDLFHIKQIFVTLINNSYKFTTSGHIYFGCKFSDVNTILYYVEDTGIGIPEEKSAVIFEPFRQADDSYLSREHGGTGLGLAIVNGLIKLMDGEVWFESVLNVGTKFYFTLPYRPVS